MTSPTSGVSDAGFDLAETDRLLTTTRAVRKRLDLERPVARQVVLDCLSVATQAPSGGNIQPWRWLVVDEMQDTNDAQAALVHQLAGPTAT